MSDNARFRAVRKAIADPGAVTGRRELRYDWRDAPVLESLPDWQARAVMEVITPWLAGNPVTQSGTTPGPVTAYLAEVREHHRQHVSSNFPAPGICVSRCSGTCGWPCHAWQLADAVEAALEMHKPYGIYDECGHSHTEDDFSADQVVSADGIGYVCADGFMYAVCRTCCTGEPGYGQTENCAGEHDHGIGKPICATSAAIATALNGEKAAS